MRWCSKFETSGIATIISTEHRIGAASGKILRGDPDEDPFDLYRGFEEIPAQQTPSAGEAFI